MSHTAVDGDSQSSLAPHNPLSTASLDVIGNPKFAVNSGFCHESREVQPLSTAVSNVGSIPDPGRVSKDSASGFMLISVGHLSKVRRSKHDGQGDLGLHSVPGISKAFVKHSDGSSLDASSVDDSSPTSSQSPVNDDDFSHDFYSKSIEAEEFDDEDLDYDDALAEDGRTVIEGPYAKNAQTEALSKGPERSVLDSRTNFSVSRNRSGTTTPHFTPEVAVVSQVFSSGITKPSIGINGHRSSPRHSGHLNFVSPLNGKLFEMWRHNSMPLSNACGVSSDIFMQVNNSHTDSHTSPFLPQTALSAHTAPVSGHLSPSEHRQSQVAAEPPFELLSYPVSGAPIHQMVLSDYDPAGSDTSAQPPMLFSHCDHAQLAAFGRPLLTCHHYLHSGAPPEVRSPQLLTVSEANQLTSTETVLDPAALPPLQPASRFRKARIHETVEQWSHGRASIHDCHLRTVPDWVSELQKKACILEQELSTALEQKVNCFSCMELKALDHNTTGRQGLRAPGALNQPVSAGYTCKSQLRFEDSTTGVTAPTCSSRKSSLFAFWDGGCRVSCRLPRRNRTCLSTFTSASSSIDQKNQDSCPVCADSFLLKGQRLVNEFPDKSSDWGNYLAFCSRLENDDSVSLDTSRHVHGKPERESSGAIPIDSPVPPSNSADPATAYLRRRNVDVIKQVEPQTVYPEPSTKKGDSHSVDSFSVAQSDLSQLTPNSADYSFKQNSCPSSIENASHYVLIPTDSISPSSFPLRASNPPVTGLVPPTSPSLEDPSTQAGRRAKSPDSAFQNFSEDGKRVIPNGFYHPADQLPVLSSLSRPIAYPGARLHVGSGSYHNVTHPDQAQQRGLRIPSPTSPVDGSLRSTLTGVNSIGTGIVEPLVNGAVHQNGRFSGCYTSPIHESGFKKAPTGHHQSKSSTKLPCLKLHKENGHESLPSCGSLEARLTKSMDVIRSAMENAIQHELAAAYSENLRLSAEVQRLTREVSVLRGYQIAFHAVRPYVAPEILDQLGDGQSAHLPTCDQHMSVISHQVPVDPPFDPPQHVH